VTTSQPTENSQGQLTWNPSVGLYFKPAAVKRESYGGIIGAIQDQLANSGNVVKAYPENFAGIIAALQDLKLGELEPGSDTGDKPPGGDVIINDQGNPEWIITEQPLDGQLWFDTRQGRMFVWVTDNWYQTNGGDGIPIVTSTPDAPELDYVVPGQLWYNKVDNELYVFAGDYEDAQGNIGPDVVGTPVWVLLVNGPDTAQTTATLPLAPGILSVSSATILPPVDPNKFLVQKDLNEYTIESLLALEQGIQEAQPEVSTGVTPPADPKAGQLWYDTEALELSIYYQDDNTSQWVPTSAQYSIDSQLDPIRALLAAETAIRQASIADLTQLVNASVVQDTNTTDYLQNQITVLEAKLNNAPVVDETQFVTNTAFNSSTNAITSRLTTLETATPDYSSLITKVEAEAEHSALEALIGTKATPADVAEVAAQIPDVSNFLVQQDVETAIANITTEYLPRTGGVLTGSFQLQKNDYALPGLDFSGASWYSKCAFQFTANSPTPADTKFGTTDNFWEYAWEFGAEEDFCWIYNDTNKVFSITKDGPACSTLYLGDIGDNTTNGRVIHNKIDVKERLNTYQTAFEGMRQAVSSSTDYDSLKSGLLTALANV
jgi:hypothetical protein